MNAKSLLNWGILDWIKDFFLGILDNIPRLVYFFFAAFASGVDALQNLLRKLAGLDVYYTKVISDNKLDHLLEGDFGYQDITIIKKGYSARWGQDPLTEFIYGTLGIGDSASAYRSLTTVFWSLSIFAIIILVLSTMVAMIKSHYSEDYQNTNPWKYIYTAIKAVLTYAVMPVVVVLGMQISHFILQTLDNITAGTDASKVEAMFGRTVAKDNFKTSIYAEGTPQEKETYTHYDYFGAGGPTTTTTFGGMLFTAAAYSANRLRSGTISLSEMEATGVFASSNCPDYAKLTDPEAKQNYAADQVDFAFSNNLKWTNSKSIWTLTGWFENVRYVEYVDFMSIKVMSSFSKYNITAVWMFYDLWQFQFIVAFGGGVTAVGILLSVILGMMSRLIKGAALFLIYPPLIALAPLDNFKAFKSWGSQFMQQVLMAYGAVIGMNILMLVLPLVQNISWYGPGMGIIDAIVNMIILIVGLLMTKDFIVIVSGFIGGANANSIGQDLKTEVGGAVKKGFSFTSKLAGGVAKVGVAGGVAVGKHVSNSIKASRIRSSKDGGYGALSKEDKDSLFADGGLRKKSDQTLEAALEQDKDGKFVNLNGKAGIDKKAAGEARKAYQAAKTQGKTDDEARFAAKNAITESLKNQTDKATGLSKYDVLKKKDDDKLASIQSDKKSKDKEKSKDAKALLKKYKKEEKVEGYKEDVASGKLKLADGRTAASAGAKQFFAAPWKSFGKGIGNALKEDLPGLAKEFGKHISDMKIGKSIADSFLKATGELGQAFGLDKVLNGMKDVLGPSLTMKGGVFEHKAAEGDALHRENAATAKAHNEQQIRAQEKTNQLLTQLIQSNQDIKKASDATNLAISRLKMPNNNTNNGNGKK